MMMLGSFQAYPLSVIYHANSLRKNNTFKIRVLCFGTSFEWKKRVGWETTAVTEHYGEIRFVASLV